jgi:hypothetical protein
MSFDCGIQVYIIFLAGQTLSKCAQLRGSRLIECRRNLPENDFNIHRSLGGKGCGKNAILKTSRATCASVQSG